MPDHPDETARAARPRDAWRAADFRAPPGDDRAAAPPWRGPPDAGPIGTTHPVTHPISHTLTALHASGEFA